MSYAIEAVARQAADEVLPDVDDDEELDDELEDDDEEDVSEEEDEDEEPSLFAAVDLDEPPLVLLDEEPRLSFR